MQSKLLKIGALLTVFLGVSSVSAASILYPYQGGTGIGNVPTYGQVLVGNAGGTYTLTATSSLGITGSSGGGTFPFTPTINFGAVANATNTPIWFQAGFQSSSTSLFSEIALFYSGVTIVRNATGFGTTLTGNGAASGNINLTLPPTSNGLIVASDGTGVANDCVKWLDQFTVTDTGSACGGSGSSFSYPFPLLGLATSSPIMLLASTTIGNGNQAGGLTVSGGATTTGGLIVTSGNVGVGTTTPFAKLSVLANNGNINKLLFLISSSTASATTTLFSIDNAGHVIQSGPVPIVSACGSGATIVGNDNVGRIVAGSGGPATCAVTFVSPWQNTPICQVLSDNNPTITYAANPTVSGMSVEDSSGDMSSQSFTYRCSGY